MSRVQARGTIKATSVPYVLYFTLNWLSLPKIKFLGLFFILLSISKHTSCAENLLPLHPSTSISIHLV